VSKVTSIASPSKIWSSRLTLRRCFLTLISQEARPTRISLLEIVENEIFDEEESFVFQSVVFDNESKKLIIEKSDVKNKKGKSRSEVNLRNMWPSQISRIHKATGDALDDSIGGLEEENIKLKERIKELEETLMPLPLLSIPLEIVGPTMPCNQNKRILKLTHISQELCGE
jgi:hypothetical protein